MIRKIKLVRKWLRNYYLDKVSIRSLHIRNGYLYTGDKPIMYVGNTTDSAVDVLAEAQKFGL